MKERLVFIDYLKGIGILSVFFMHSISYNIGYLFPTNENLLIIDTFGRGFLMPFFVFISGFTFYYFYLKNNKLTNIYIYRFLQIYLVFGTTMIFTKFVFSSHIVNKITLFNLVFNFFVPDTSMWYIWFLIIISLFSLLIYKLNISRNLLFLMWIVLFIFSIFLIFSLGGYKLPISISYLIYLPPFYCFGIYVASINFRDKFIKSRFFLFVSVVVVVVYIFSLSFQTDVNYRFSLVFILIRYANAIALIYLIFRFTLKIEKYDFKFLTYFGKNSLYFYLLHTYFLIVLILMIKLYYPQISPFYSVSLLFLIVTVICVLCTKFIRSFSWIDKIFQGKLFTFKK